MKKQIKVIFADNAGIFEGKANQALSRIEAPRLVFDRNRPYLMYIVYDQTDQEQTKAGTMANKTERR